MQNKKERKKSKNRTKGTKIQPRHVHNEGIIVLIISKKIERIILYARDTVCGQ